VITVTYTLVEEWQVLLFACRSLGPPTTRSCQWPRISPSPDPPSGATSSPASTIAQSARRAQLLTREEARPALAVCGKTFLRFPNGLADSGLFAFCTLLVHTQVSKSGEEREFFSKLLEVRPHDENDDSDTQREQQHDADVEFCSVHLATSPHAAQDRACGSCQSRLN
jgi:hypothetical protein